MNQLFFSQSPPNLFEETSAADQTGSILIFVIGAALALATLVFFVKMLIEIVFRPVPNKILWIVLMLIFGFIPALIYYFTDHKKYQQSKRSAGPFPTVGNPDKN